MKNFNEIKSLWQTDDRFETSTSMVQIEREIQHFNKIKKRNNLLAIIILIACIFTLLYLIVYSHSFKMWSSYIGLLLFMTAAFFIIYSKLKRQVKLTKFETLSNHDFLIALEKEEKQIFIHKSNKQLLIFIIWAIGFLFYIYEFLSTNIYALLIGYSTLLIFIFVIWFFYKPFMSKQYQKSIQKITKHIHNLKSQTNEI